jgi:hypothetical protein
MRCPHAPPSPSPGPTLCASMLTNNVYISFRRLVVVVSMKNRLVSKPNIFKNNKKLRTSS